MIHSNGIKYIRYHYAQNNLKYEKSIASVESIFYFDESDFLYLSINDASLF